MKSSHHKSASLLPVILLACLLCAGCHGPMPLYTRAPTVPGGNGVVYIYSLSGYGDRSHIQHAGKNLRWLDRGTYLVDFALPGTNVYRVIDEEMIDFRRSLLKPAQFNVESGKTYYLRVVDHDTLLRVDNARAEEEIAVCRLRR